ncbi:acetyltransferase [Neisseria sp. HMSC064F04]|uniref:GNAT family N-acetyltransferase n=1 Tax=Neisseria mucosa TaxID=488 RepID=UPI0008A84186|nr:GNAT family N-acetyltransferase [Neisseria mucosa]OHR44628.1 acetyltransferase [Neisseria sp. HMSC064F04]
MNITPLQACHIEPLTRALYREWHDFAPWSSLEKIRAYYRKCLDRDGLPLAFAAVSEDGRLLGSAALKRFDMEEFPQYEYWLGDVFVLPEYRGKGIGHALIAHCLQTARSLRLPALYLYTPDVQAVYAKYGWREIATQWHNGETVSVMKLDLQVV